MYHSSPSKYGSSTRTRHGSGRQDTSVHIETNKQDCNRESVGCVVDILNGLVQEAVNSAHINTNKNMNINHRSKNKSSVNSGSSSGGSGGGSSSWCEDPSLPRGWRSCVPAPGRIMFYSPCGTLFTSRTQVDKFLGLHQPKEPKVFQPQQESKLTQPQPKAPRLQSRVSQPNQNNSSIVHKKSKSKNSEKLIKDINTKKGKSSAKNLKIAMEEEIATDKSDKKRKICSAQKVKSSVKNNAKNTIVNQISAGVKNVQKGGKNLKMRSKIVEEYSPEYSSDSNSNHTDSDDAISLSDDDLPEENSLKRKRSSDSEEELESKNASYNIFEDKGNISKKQHQQQPTQSEEDILLAAYRQWPVAFPELVDALVKEVNMTKSGIEQWFQKTREDCLQLLWNSE